MSVNTTISAPNDYRRARDTSEASWALVIFFYLTNDYILQVYSNSTRRPLLSPQQHMSNHQEQQTAVQTIGYTIIWAACRIKNNSSRWGSRCNISSNLVCFFLGFIFFYYTRLLLIILHQCTKRQQPHCCHVILATTKEAREASQASVNGVSWQFFYNIPLILLIIFTESVLTMTTLAHPLSGAFFSLQW